MADTTELADLETRRLRPDRLVLVVAEGHPLAERAAVALREVLDEPFVGLSHSRSLQTYLAGHAARAGRPFKLRVRLGGLDAVCRMVARGVGVAIVPRGRGAPPRETAAIRIVPLSDPWACRYLVLAARKFSALPAHARQLVDHLLAESA